MIIKEYRIVMPLTLKEYRIGQMYTTAIASEAETGGGEGLEFICNEPFTPTEGTQPDPQLFHGSYTSGQYTHKIFHLARKVPPIARMLAPQGSMELHEEAWNSYPFSRTVVSNPDYMKKNFVIKIETIHIADRGETENAHGLDAETLALREVVKIDIVNDHVSPSDYNQDEDPSHFKSEKTGRGPLVGRDWEKSVSPVMCCYKLVTVKFEWSGLQEGMEKRIHEGEQRIFTNLHRQLFCWMDRWHDLTMSDVHDMQERTKCDLDQIRNQGPVRGTRYEDDAE